LDLPRNLSKNTRKILRNRLRIVVEIEAILNDGPLTYLSSDVQDGEPLTPAHLLYGRRITSLPYPDNGDESEDPNSGIIRP
jgi:hypothetical protein